MGRSRLQVLVAIIAIGLLVTAMGYLAFSVTTVLLADYGGTLVEGIAGNPQSINPILCHSNSIDRDLCALVFSGLTRLNGKGEIEPDLAQRWEVSGDGTSYTFYLRQEVTWHDGAPFTAEDVVFTIHAIQHADFQGATFLSDMWRTVVVEQLDAYTVRFTLREPWAPFLDHTTIGVLPVHVLGSMPISEMAESKFSASPVGTGPFRISEVSARRIVLGTYSGYYQSRPYLDRIEFRFYPTDQAVMDARQRGEVTSVARILPEHLQDVQADENLTLYSAPLSGYNLVFLNLDRGIFQDDAVRQAMMYAIDRQGLVDEILGGQGIVVDSPILPFSWAYDPSVGTHEYDPLKAVTALENADWFDENSDGARERGPLKLEFTLSTNEDDATRVQLVQAISEQLAVVGIRAIPETLPWEELVRDRLRLRRYDAVLTGWQDLPPDPDPYPYWHSSQANENGLNFANYIDEPVDRLLAEARSIIDAEQRYVLYQEFQHLFAEEVPSLLLYQPVYNYAMDSSIHGVQIGPMSDSSARFATVTGWYLATQRMLYSEAKDKGLVTSRR